MGGTVDKSGKVIWTAHVPLEEQPAFYEAHPPSALAALTCKPIALSHFVFDGHGEPVNAIFELTCPCGGTRFTVLGHFDEDENLGPPISIECSACEVAHEIFDSRKHGYDAVVGNAAAYDVDDDVDELLADDVDPPHHVIVRFEFPSDHLGDDEWKGREQELFSWISIVARDPETGELALVFESECA